jgi:hypothetical protein
MPDPSDLADKLPERPLRPAEVDDICNQLDWSTAKVSYETESGQPYVPVFYCFESHKPGGTAGDAYALRLNDEMTEWTGSVERRDVEQDTWMTVCEALGGEMGAEVQLESVVLETEEGELQRNLSE